MPTSISLNLALGQMEASLQRQRGPRKNTRSNWKAHVYHTWTSREAYTVRTGLWGTVKPKHGHCRSQLLKKIAPHSIHIYIYMYIKRKQLCNMCIYI